MHKPGQDLDSLGGCASLDDNALEYLRVVRRIEEHKVAVKDQVTMVT